MLEQQRRQQSLTDFIVVFYLSVFGVVVVRRWFIALTTPLFQSVFNVLGETLARLQQDEEAERWYQAALTAQPDHVPAHITYGKLLAKNVRSKNQYSLLFIIINKIIARPFIIVACKSFCEILLAVPFYLMFTWTL